MTFTCTIDASTVDIRLGSMQIDPVVSGVDTLMCDVYSDDGSLRPSPGEEIIITQDSVDIFGGIILTAREQGAAGPNTPIITTISAVSFKTLFEDFFVTYTVASGTTLKSFLQTIETDHFTTLGVTLWASQVTGPNLPSMQFDNVSLLTVYQKLSEVTNYYLDVTAAKVVSMKALGTAAPFNIAVGDGNMDGDLIVQTSRKDYANRVVVIAGQPGLRDLTESFVGDGTSDEFTIQLPIAGPFAPLPTADGVVGYGVVDYPSSTPGANESLAGLSAPAGFVWEYDPAVPSIRRRTAAPTNLTTFDLRYQAQFPITVTADDAAAQTADGYVKTRTFSEPDIYDKAQAQARADELLETLVAQEQQVEFSTRTAGLRPGMSLTINIPARAVNGSFVVQDVSITNDIGKSALRHQVTALGGSSLRPSYWRGLIQGWLGGGISVSASVPSVTGSGGVAAPPEMAVQYNSGGQLAGSIRLLADPQLTGGTYGWGPFPSVLAMLPADDSGYAWVASNASAPAGNLSGFYINDNGDAFIEHEGRDWYVYTYSGDYKVYASAGDIWLTSGGNNYVGVGNPTTNYTALRGNGVLGGIAFNTFRVTGTSHTIDASGGTGGLYLFRPSGNATCNLPALSASGVSPESEYNRVLWICNDTASGYTVTIDPNSTESIYVNGIAQTTLVLQPGQSVCLCAQATNVTGIGWKVLSSHGGGPVAAALGTGAVPGQQFPVGRNSSGNGAAGCLVLYDAAGTPYYLWVDATGDLRIHTAAPTEDGTTVSDTAGTVVGAQT